MTEPRTDGGLRYPCAIKHVYSNRIVGYSLESRMKASLAVAALRHAVARPVRPWRRSGTPTGQPIQAASACHLLLHNGLHGSMGCVGRAATTPRGVVLRAPATQRPRPATMATLAELR
jgi:transposase InsO family protein